jgi:hypothetical protein
VGRTLLSDALDVDFDLDFARVGRTLLSDAFDLDFDLDFDSDVDFAHVGRTLLSDAFDLSFDFDFDPDVDFASDREGHGLSRAAKDPPKSPRLQPLKGRSHRPQSPCGTDTTVRCR